MPAIFKNIYPADHDSSQYAWFMSNMLDLKDFKSPMKARQDIESDITSMSQMLT